MYLFKISYFFKSKKNCYCFSIEFSTQKNQIMKKFSALSKNLRKFELFDENQIKIAEMNYLKWYSYDAEISTTKGTSSIKIEGTWSWNVFQYDVLGNKIREFKMGWKDFKIIENSGIEYVLELSSFWKYQFVLKNRAETGLVKLKPIFSWKSFDSIYEIEVADHFEVDSEFLFGLIHCINYQNSIAAAT